MMEELGLASCCLDSVMDLGLAMGEGGIGCRQRAGDWLLGSWPAQTHVVEHFHTFCLYNCSGARHSCWLLDMAGGEWQEEDRGSWLGTLSHHGIRTNSKGRGCDSLMLRTA